MKKLRATKGSLGVQVLRGTRGGVAEFMTISYWGSRDEIRAYAGDDIAALRERVLDEEILAMFTLLVLDRGSVKRLYEERAA